MTLTGQFAAYAYDERFRCITCRRVWSHQRDAEGCCPLAERVFVCRLCSAEFQSMTRLTDHFDSGADEIHRLARHLDAARSRRRHI